MSDRRNRAVGSVSPSRGRPSIFLEEEQFRALAEVLPHLVWTNLPDGSGFYFNSQWADYTGIPVEKMTSIQWGDIVHSDDAERTRERWLASMTQGIPHDVECRFRRHDGVYHWFKVRAAPIRDSSGGIIKWVGTCTDIHDHVELEAELQKARRDLEKRVEDRTTKLRELVQELESFSYSVSHDLRSPLRAMLGFAILAIQECDDQLTPNLRDYLSRIVSGASRADRLIQDVLTYSRTTRGNLRLTPVDLEPFLQEVLEQYPEFQHPKAELVVEKPLLKVVAHEACLAQCITNLLDNAIKFIPPNTLPRVKIWTEPLNGDVRIWIEDNGIGIEKGDLDRIFSLFERIHSNNQYEGTGLGLAIVRKGAERMGGSVGVESELGRGSRFYIQLRRHEG